MYNFVLKFHSGWAYLGVLAVCCLMLLAIWYFAQGKPIDTVLKKTTLYTMIGLHIQLLAGIVLYFVSPIVQAAMESGMGAAMKDSTLRLYLVEHPSMMIIGIVFITLANKRVKKESKLTPVTLVFICLSALAILSRIPYSAWMS